MTPARLPFLCLGALLVAASPVAAQMSLPTAVDLALHSSPRVRMAESEVLRAKAGVNEAYDVFIPALAAGAGIGKTFGFPLGQPSIFNLTAQSLVFNFSQFDYIRSARYGLSATELALKDAREAIAADTALAYIAVARDEQRDAALTEESDFATRLAGIAQERFDAGRDSALELTQARLTAAQIKLSRLHAQNETTTDREHLARLTGLPATALHLGDAAFPETPVPETEPTVVSVLQVPSIAAGYANAHSKAEQAFGDARYLYRPQFTFGLQYDRFATKLNNYDTYYPAGSLKPNNAQIGVQITLPFFDRAHQARARASAAAASSALHEADYNRDLLLDGAFRLAVSTTELRARRDVADLEQQLARQQLDALLVELNNPSTGGVQRTPKDEQTSRIAEREKYLAVLDCTYQLHQAEINLLRQTGTLEQWVHAALLAPAPAHP